MWLIYDWNNPNATVLVLFLEGSEAFGTVFARVRGGAKISKMYIFKQAQNLCITWVKQNLTYSSKLNSLNNRNQAKWKVKTRLNTDIPGQIESKRINVSETDSNIVIQSHTEPYRVIQCLIESCRGKHSYTLY